MNELITSGALQGLKSLFQKKTEHNVIIDPFSCLIKLSLLRFLDAGTKISIHNNCLYFNSPTYVQGIIRFMYGDNREHLHNLYLPIQKSVEWYWNDKNNDMTSMSRSTGFTATASIELILNGYFKDNGIFPPELVGKKEGCTKFILNYLKDRDLSIERS